MKVNELMVGDWYYDIDLHKNRKFHQLQFGEAYGDPTYELKLIPIPLTEEILEKNGFVMYKKDWSSSRWLLRHDGNIIEILWEEGEQSLRYFTVGGFDVELNYVHELQHALRLCGLSDLADNFQI